MTWVRLEDAFTEHPKVIGLSDAAFRLHVRGLCYAVRYLTDGYVPFGFVNEHVDELVEAGLWDMIGDGYTVHDFTAYNRTRDQVEQERSTKRAAGRAGGQASAAARGRAESNPESETVTETEPQPETVDLKPSRAVARQRVYTPEFERFWKTYPSEGRRDKPKAAVEFERAWHRLSREQGALPKVLLDSALEDIVEGAQRYAADPNRDPAKTKYAQGWLSGDRWNDPPLPAESPNGRAVVPGARSNALARELGS